MTTATERFITRRVGAMSDAQRVPGWVRYVTALMGKLGTWEVAYRNQDVREWLEARSHEFAAYAKDRDMDALYDAQLRREEAETEAPYRYCRCANCGTIIHDPIIRTSAEAPV